MKIKKYFLLLFSIITSFYVIPYLLIYFSNTENLNKNAFIIMLVTGFCSFAINLLYLYYIEKSMYVPATTSIFSIGLLFIFNSSAWVLMIIISIFAFFGYFIGTIFK